MAQEEIFTVTIPLASFIGDYDLASLPGNPTGNVTLIFEADATQPFDPSLTSLFNAKLISQNFTTYFPSLNPVSVLDDQYGNVSIGTYRPVDVAANEVGATPPDGFSVVFGAGISGAFSNALGYPAGDYASASLTTSESYVSFTATVTEVAVGAAGATVFLPQGHNVVNLVGGVTFDSGGGSNNYVYARGTGAVTIANGAQNDLAPESALIFTGGSSSLTMNAISYARSGLNLLVTDGIAGDDVTLANWFAGGSNQLTAVFVDPTSVGDASLVQVNGALSIFVGSAAQITADENGGAFTGVTHHYAVNLGSADFLANDALFTALIAAHEIASIHFTDTTAPNLTLSGANLIANATAFNWVASPYKLTVTGALLSGAQALALNTHVSSIQFSDAASAVGSLANYAALGKLAAAAIPFSITPTDTGIPTITLTGSELTKYGSAPLSHIIGAFNGTLTADAAGEALQHVTGSTMTLFQGAAANLNGDTITGLAAGDQIRFNGLIGSSNAQVTLTSTGANTAILDVLDAGHHWDIDLTGLFTAGAASAAVAADGHLTIGWTSTDPGHHLAMTFPL